MPTGGRRGSRDSSSWGRVRVPPPAASACHPRPPTARSQKVLLLVHAHTASQGHRQAASAHAGGPQVLPPQNSITSRRPPQGLLLGVHAPFPPSALSLLLRPSAPGLRNPSLDWDGPPPRGSRQVLVKQGLAEEALLTGRPSPCPPQVTVPPLVTGLRFRFTQNLPGGRRVCVGVSRPA